MGVLIRGTILLVSSYGSYRLGIRCERVRTERAIKKIKEQIVDLFNKSESSKNR